MASGLILLSVQTPAFLRITSEFVDLLNDNLQNVGSHTVCGELNTAPAPASECRDQSIDLIRRREAVLRAA
jgi:hypothetical protein